MGGAKSTMIPSDTPREGDVIAGKYRVARVLGEGGMGVVLAARHIQLDEMVALKFLLPHALSNAEAVARFEREARAACKIKNDHVARVSDVGTLENGSPFMVMEYLEGNDLAAALASHGPMPTDLAVDFVVQASEAIAEAHTLGIVHRDLKPANLFWTQRADGRPFIKVLDFGISKLTSVDAAPSMTRTTAFLGSPLYMSPEQMQASKTVDARSDIWSLGVILFELVTGHPPFSALAVTELAIKIATEPHTPVRTLCADAPVGLEQVITRCLTKDRNQRFQTVGELVSALQPFGPSHARASVEKILATENRAGVSTGSTPLAGASRPFAAAQRTDASWGNTAQSHAQGAPRPTAARRLLVTVTGAVVLVGLVAAIFVHRRPGAIPTPALGAAGESTSAANAQAIPKAEPRPLPTSVELSAPATAPPSTIPSPATAVPNPATPAAAPVHEDRARAHGPPSVAPPLLPRSSPAPAVLPAAAPPSSPRAVSCNPPYVINSTGDRVYKPECL